MFGARALGYFPSWVWFIGCLFCGRVFPSRSSFGQQLAQSVLPKRLMKWNGIDIFRSGFDSEKGSSSALSNEHRTGWANDACLEKENQGEFGSQVVNKILPLPNYRAFDIFRKWTFHPLSFRASETSTWQRNDIPPLTNYNLHNEWEPAELSPMLKKDSTSSVPNRSFNRAYCLVYHAKNTKFCRTLCANLGGVTNDKKNKIPWVLAFYEPKSLC